MAYTGSWFLPTIFIEEDIGDEYFNEEFKYKFYSNNLLKYLNPKISNNM